MRSDKSICSGIGAKLVAGVTNSSCRYPEAVVHLEVLLEYSPSHVNALSQLATCHMQMGHAHKAREMFKQVLKMNPNQTMALQNYGMCVCGCVVNIQVCGKLM